MLVINAKGRNSKNSMKFKFKQLDRNQKFVQVSMVINSFLEATCGEGVNIQKNKELDRTKNRMNEVKFCKIKNDSHQELALGVFQYVQRQERRRMMNINLRLLCEKYLNRIHERMNDLIKKMLVQKVLSQVEERIQSQKKDNNYKFKLLLQLIKQIQQLFFLF
ncbi:unnamed protein product [Paramecium octaurelia]|uniref:Uncharacterized protein n=1 Tax=Paramecium octaurelia TaxID=43137 RepID=A0A8S1WGE7_PAROT|nr:unnamed protein product [Paramecium octaurelia]